MAAPYGSMKRRLFARVAARVFDAMAIELQGLIDGMRKLLVSERKSLRNGIRQLEKQLTVRRIRLEALAEDRLRMLPQRKAKLRLTTHQNALRLSKLTVRLVRVECRLAGNVPGICFGSRKLFRQQHHLELTGFGSREAWLRQWQSSCSHQIFFVGSKDETAGNQLCQLHGNADRT